MKRRQFLAAAAAVPVSAGLGNIALGGAALAAPAVGGKANTLIYVPQANLTSIDPVWTTARVTRDFAGMVYETLFGRDEQLNAKPQMLSGYTVEDNGLRWTMKLRDGLLFHDGQKVLARDCVASLQRWMKRDPIGATITERLNALEAPDDTTIVWRLKKPMPWLPTALAKTQPSPVIMPERLAQTEPSKQVPEAVGSGPFRFIRDQWVAGHSAAFEKFDKYSPRPEPASFAAGGYNVLVDRVNWQVIADASTAANALISGEVDWVDSPLPDLIPLLKGTQGLEVDLVDIYGTYGALRPNWLQGPTTNPGVRRAILAAIDQVEVMTAVMGADKSLSRAPVGIFLPGTPGASDAGMDLVRKRHSPDEVKAMLKAAGYGGEKLVVMHPSDQIYYNAMIGVVAPRLRAAGFNIDEQTVDWGTVVQRRTSKEPLDKGGWSLFPYGAPAWEYTDPIFTAPLRAIGAHSWFGWPTDAKLEELRDAWMDSTDPAAQKKLAAEIQVRAFEVVPFVPLGQYLPPSAWRNTISRPLKGAVPVFWNVKKA